MGVDGQRHATAAFSPWMIRYPCTEGWVGPQGRSGRVRKSFAPTEIFLFSCTMYFIWTCFFLLIVLYFAFSSLLTTQTSMLPAGFELAILAGERSQTYALDRAAIGIGIRSPDSPSRKTTACLITYFTVYFNISDCQLILTAKWKIWNHVIVTSSCFVFAVMTLGNRSPTFRRNVVRSPAKI